MARTIEWEIPAELQPKPEDYAFDLDRALGSVLGLHATVPEDAFTAGTLGTERAGSGVLIRKDGLFVPKDLKPLNPAHLKRPSSRLEARRPAWRPIRDVKFRPG